MISFVIMESISFVFFLLFLLLAANLFLRLFAIDKYHQFKKYNKTIIIWVLSISIVLILLRIPGLLSQNINNK